METRGLSAAVAAQARTQCCEFSQLWTLFLVVDRRDSKKLLSQ